MDSDKRSSPERWRLEDILKYLDVDDEHEAEEILHFILTSTGILTWNGKGEIVYRGHNIRGTNIVDLLKYCVMSYHPYIPEPTCRRYHCMICDNRVYRGDFTNVIRSCPHCHLDEIMDVRTDERQSFDHKIGEQSNI